MTTETRKKGRVRKTNKVVQTKAVETQLDTVRQHAENFYAHNTKKNFHDRTAKAERKELAKILLEMKDRGQKFFYVETVEVDKKPMTVDIGLQEGETQTVNSKLLKSLVTEEQLLLILESATKTKIEEVAGATVADRVVSKKGNGTYNAFVVIHKGA